MRRLVALLLVLVLCGSFTRPISAAVTWVRSTVTITVAGQDRSYLVVRPATVTGSLPVLMELHGAGATPELELERSGFLDVTGPAILVYPAGQDKYWNAGSCCGTSDADDVTFLTAVVKQVLANQADADPQRVYLAGYSNGGRMAYRMACARPTLFAAVAVFGAVASMTCTNPAAVSLLVAAGTADPELTIPAGGTRKVVNGFTEPTVEGEVSTYVAAAGATTSKTVVVGTLHTTTWTGPKATVQLALYEGADHAWPGSMAELAWAFFSTAQPRSDSA